MPPTDRSDSALAELTRLAAMIRNAPKSVSYIVLGPNWSPLLPYVDGEDAMGRRYLLTSPAILDEMQHHKWGDLDVLATEAMSPGSLAAIQVYRRQDMPAEWPDGWPEHG